VVIKMEKYEQNIINYLTKHHIQNKCMADMRLLAYIYIYIKHTMTGGCPRDRE